MNGIPAYFKRIQGRLITTFAVVMAGTIVIWYLGMISVGRFASDVASRVDALQQALDIGGQLEASTPDRSVAAEHYVVSGDSAHLSEFRQLAPGIRDLERRYLKLPRLQDAEFKQLTRIAELHNELEVEQLRTLAL